jgi:hypothetical protein
VTLEIPLGERFDDPYGRFLNHDAYSSTQLAQLRKQQHVNIRSCRPNASRTLTMFDLDLLSMSGFDVDPMSALESTTPIQNRPQENWTTGVVGATAFNQWFGVTLTLGAGTNTTQSVMSRYPVDISQMASTDVISIPLPSFPLASVTTATSFIDLTSDSAGSFGTATDSIAFNASTVALTAGHSELRFPISALTNVDKTRITGVQFRIQATGAATMVILGVRALSANWVFPPMDTDTLYGHLVRPPSRNGDPAAASAFPTGTTSWPIVFRAANPPGTADPRPIDISAAMVVNPGTLTVAGTSTAALYFREQPLDQNTQLDLDATFTQDDLNNFGTRLITNAGTSIWTAATLPAAPVQPDFGRALYDSRTQGTLDQYQQSGLDSDTQFSLERTQDTVSAAYLEVKLTWDNTGASTLTVKNESGTGQTFATPFTVSANSVFAISVDLVDDSMRVRIFQLDSYRNVTGLLYDSTTIVDGSFLNRRKGRIGWHSLLQDGSAYIESVLPRSVSFGEYVSLPFNSDTPVRGAQLSAHSSPKLELVTSVSSSGWGGTVASDPGRSNSGRAYKITYDQVNRLQGVQTNGLFIDSPAETTVAFDILVPTGATPIAFLYGARDRIVQLRFGPILAETWQHVELSLSPYADNNLVGTFNLVLITSTGPAWYLDNLSVNTRVVAWDGRSNEADPWSMDTIDWMPFLDTVNGVNDGLVFPERGAGMQLRARAVRQTASITDIAAQPRYAELGGFAWRDQVVTWRTGLAPSFTSSVSSRTVTFASTSTSTGDPIIAHLWSFGDGVQDYGPNPVHTYTNAGTYTVVLTVIDSKGQRQSATATVTVT